jgi:hypothetical protein
MRSPPSTPPTTTSANYFRGDVNDALLVGGVVPGVSVVEVALLKRRAPAITTTQQLVGEFLKLNCDERLFQQLLVDARFGLSESKRCAESIGKRMAEYCQQPGHAAAPASPAAVAPGVSTTQASWLNNLIGTDPLVLGMVPGIGEQAIKKLKTLGNINTPCELMGRFLVLGRDQAEFFRLVLEPVGIRLQDLQKDKTSTLPMLEKKAVEFCKGKAPRSRPTPSSNMRPVAEGDEARDRTTSGGRSLTSSFENADVRRVIHNHYHYNIPFRLTKSQGMLIIAIVVLLFAYYMRAEETLTQRLSISGYE